MILCNALRTMSILQKTEERRVMPWRVLFVLTMLDGINWFDSIVHNIFTGIVCLVG